jgi:ribonuclease BN (tRNA processing enzyme)
MSSLTLLGTGTCQIEFGRRASSVLLELDKTYILFDCGHGIAQRLLECSVQHHQVDHIILSHFHPDHISDLIPLIQAGAYSKHNSRRTDMHIYGPSGVRQVVDRLLGFFDPDFLEKLSYQIHVNEVAPGPFTIARYPFESVSLPPAGNQGIRFSHKGKTYALTGDAYFGKEEEIAYLAFLQGVDLAVIDYGHISSEAKMGKLAAASQAKVIVCSHLYQRLQARDLQKKAEEKGYNGTIVVGYDLMSFIL